MGAQDTPNPGEATDMNERNGMRTAALLFSALALLVGTGCGQTRAVQEAEEEEEVQVGYGTQPKDEVTGSISSVSGAEIDQRPVRRVEDLLVGRVAGVQVYEAPGGYLAVRIRGTSSFHGSNEPLYVVDGMPLSPGPGGALIGINPRDVKSIEVLKDAAATAIYGSRGANGVVVVTTKRGGN